MSYPADAKTLVSLFARRVAAGGERQALHVKRDGQFQALTWNELAAKVRRMAAVLHDLDVRPGDRVVQVSENRLEWIVLDLAVHTMRGVHVALHSVLSGPQIARQICDAESRLAFVSNAAQLTKLAEVRELLPRNLRPVVFDDDGAVSVWEASAVKVPPLPVRACLLLEKLMPLVDESLGRPLVEQAERETTPDDLATLLYSSGTTGEPKGVMLTHGNLASNAAAMDAEFAELEADDLRLAWLPLSHIFARTCDLYAWIARGSQLALAESRETLLADCAAVRPTFLNGVPYFYDKLHRHLRERGEAEKPGRLRELLGGRIRLCCSGGAALADATAEFFHRQGVPLVQGYGLTESSPVISLSTSKVNKLGAVGRAIRGVEIRIAADGEILTRGPHVMQGYWRQPTATAAAIADGWLHTGDLGRLDADGFLTITGRKKELIVTAGGKNIVPTQIESLLTDEPLIAQSIVVGDGRNFLCALIVPNPDALRAAIIAQAIPVASRTEALAHPRIHELYRAAIDRRLAVLSQCEQIGRFALLDRGFTIESGELTPTLKLRRKVIEANFAAEIAALYAQE